MKKKIICAAITIALLAIIFSALIGGYVLYVGRGIDYSFDKELFKKAK